MNLGIQLNKQYSQRDTSLKNPNQYKPCYSHKTVVFTGVNGNFSGEFLTALILLIGTIGAKAIMKANKQIQTNIKIFRSTHLPKHQKMGKLIRIKDYLKRRL